MIKKLLLSLMFTDQELEAICNGLYYVHRNHRKPYVALLHKFWVDVYQFWGKRKNVKP